MPPNGEILRRTNVSATTTRDRQTKNANASNGDSSRRRERRRARRLEEEQNRRAAIVFSASFLLFALALILFFTRPKGPQQGLDSERYARAKALRNAYLSGDNQGGSNNEKGVIKHGRRFINGIRYFDPRQFPPLPGHPSEPYKPKGRQHAGIVDGDDEWQKDENTVFVRGPKVDYTKHRYSYPEVVYEPQNDGSYPPLYRMANIFETWGQDDLDSPPDTIVEVLQHFDFQDPDQLKAAIKYRDLELPFKVYNVPELKTANKKWTDTYVASHFNGSNGGMPKSEGRAQQSIDSFFAFFRAPIWSEELLGPPPSVDVGWTYDKWARHAVYADEVSLPRTEKHYYWQSGVPREERLADESKWTFVSRDLPSFSSPEPTFFGFNPPEQKGIQCRFGERGVTAATHYDGGRNMIAMITGAKRYILSPPNVCPQLGIVTSRKHPSYRHSMLNFGRVTLLDDKDGGAGLSGREREWLQIAAEAPTLSTVLKAGEVLYVPSHWFHYIVSLQKSAQCNTRSGISYDGNDNFGGREDVEECIAGGDD